MIECFSINLDWNIPAFTMYHVMHFSFYFFSFILHTLYFSLKSDISTSGSQTLCRLNETVETVGSGSSLNTETSTYSFNRSGQLAASTSTSQVGSSAPSYYLSTVEYNTSGKISKISAVGSNTFNTYEYNGNMISKLLAFTDGTLSGFTVYTSEGNVYSSKRYTAQNLLQFEANYTLSGSNFIGYSYTNYNLNGTIKNSGIVTYSNFDDKLSPAFILYQNIPGLDIIYGRSKNNPKLSTKTTSNYLNGILTSTSKSTITFAYSYNSFGVVTQTIETTLNDTSSSKRIFNYTYSNCN